MDHNVVHPSADAPPGYSELPPPAAAGPSAPYGQSTLLHDDGGKAHQGPPPQPAWSDPTTNQYPPTGYQYPAPPPPTAPPYAAYPPSGYGTPYYGGAPPPPPPQQPQQQQQQQVVVVNGGPTQPIIYHQHQTFIGQMILACFVMWCCNCLFGLVAFILAGKHDKLCPTFFLSAV